MATNEEPETPEVVGAGATPDPPRGLVWRDLTEERIAELDAEADPAAKLRLLSETMEVNHYDDNPRSEILVDFCLYNLMFCDENDFSAAKKSAFFSIMKRVFEHGFQSADVVPMQQSLAFFKTQVLEHSVEAPPDRVAVFSLQEVRLLTEFVATTFYRHYKAYQLCFTRRQPTEQREKVLQVESPFCPPPLEAAEAK